MSLSRSCSETWRLVGREKKKKNIDIDKETKLVYWKPAMAPISWNLQEPFMNHFETWTSRDVLICTLSLLKHGHLRALEFEQSINQLSHLETWSPMGVRSWTAPVRTSTLASWLPVSEHSGQGLYLRCLVFMGCIL